MTCPKPTADTNRVSLYLAPEADDCWGDVPGVGDLAPKAYEVRYTGETLVHNKQTVVSNTIRTDRMRDTLSEVAVTAEGDVNYELAFRDWELMLQGALANNFEYLIERSVLAGTVNAVSATARFLVTSGVIDFDNFVEGADVWVSGFEDYSRNNGRFQVVDIGAGGSYITVDDESGGTVLGNETPTSGSAQVFKTGKGRFTDLEVTANNTVSSVTTNFLTSVNLSVGQWIRMAGWSAAANNGLFKIAAIAANALTLDTTALANETAATVVMTAQRLKNGILRKSFLLEKGFGDIAQFMSFTGCRVGQMTMTVESQALVTGAFSVMGKEADAASASVIGKFIPAGIKDALNATTNVGNIQEGGVAIASAIRSVNLAVNNNLRQKPQIGSRSSVDIGYGFVDVTGSVQVYFSDLIMLNKFLDHTESQLSFRFTDSEGNSLVFTLPRLFFSSGSPTAPSGNEDVLLPMEFTAVRDNATDSVIIIDALAA